MNLARAEHVNDLEHDEGGEEESPVTRRTSGVVAGLGLVVNRFPLGSESNATFLVSGVEGGLAQLCEHIVNLGD